MNHVFRVVWNRALNQWVVASELVRGRVKGARSVSAGVADATMTRLGAGILTVLLGMPMAHAHTISIGYENSGDRSLTFWYGTYHPASQTTYTEGSLRLQGPNGMDVTLPFALLSHGKPGGLVDGDTNFYNNGLGALGGINLDPRGEPANWQGLQFTNLFAGTYTFTYVPIANPTQVWAPESPVILSSTITIITADLSTAPRIETGQVVNETQVGDPLLFDGGTLRIEHDTTLPQDVSFTNAGGTLDTNGHELWLNGDIDGRGDMTKEGDGTLFLRGNNTNTGDIVINDGIVNVIADSNLGSPDSNVIFNGGTLQWGDDFDLGNQRDLVLNAGGGTLDVQTHDTHIDQAITGTGDLTKTGTGTLELAGNNTYTGGTTIDEGTLALVGNGSLANSDGVAIGSDGTLDISGANGDATLTGLTGDGDVALGGNSLTLTGGNGSFDGRIDGTGSVIVTGGTQALTGNNGFSGGLVVAGGTVQVSSDASFGTGVVTIGDGVLQTTGGFTSDNDFVLSSTHAVVDTAGHDVTFNGDLSGSGSLNKIGDGTLTLKGENSQDGLNVKGGTVEFASDASLGRAGSVVTIADNTTLRSLDSMTITHEIFVDNTRSAVFDTNGFDITVAGDIGGSGIVQKLGGGVLTLSGNNSQVLMQVQGGSIAVTSQEAAGAAGGDIYIGQDGNFTALSGMNVTQNVHVTGDNARFETRGAPVSLTGSLDGSHCLIKSGSGRLDMRAGGSNAIGACIEQGDLAFNSTFAGNVWVYADGTASGSGRVEGSMDVKGVLSPGNSPGTLVVAGNVVQNAGSVLVADIDGRTAGNGAGHFDTLRVVGAGHTYTAGGELQPILRGITGDATNTFVPNVGDSFAIVQAEGGVTGSYDSLLQPQSGLAANTRFDVRYDANAVVLMVTPDRYELAMSTRNTAAVGAAIDAVRTAAGARGTDGTARVESSLMGLRLADMASAFDQLDGEFHATTRGVLADDARRVREAALDRMSGGRSPLAKTQQPGDAVWAQVLMAGGSLDSDGNAGAAEYNGSGLLVGAEHRFENGWQLGVMGGSERTDMEVASRASSGDADTLHLGLYADQSWGAFAVRGGVGVAQHSIDSERFVNLPGLSQRLVADYDAQTRQAYVEGGYAIEGEHGSLEPYVQFARVETKNDAFAETGGSVALNVDGETTTLDVSTVGVRGELSLTSGGTGEGWFNLRGGLGWRHASGDLSSQTRLGWNGGADFSVAGTPLAEDAAVAELGVSAWLSPRTLLEVGYEGQYADEGRDHQAMARLSIRF
ncbi:autotransporter domain-containing protein [Lysobacter sp. LF1]|uniref:Autotransporter domain-containing protein n=1 Tax=Lysobacter stagni TaxID=3045172 RepID=A0ABT6XI82_9GAMM|nr:autotransporter domain-containing protein [Lysobacter sp. LF1]MDI9239673.1 autotransporter domain-containing protein [Lysobacter sp. LF1]